MGKTTKYTERRFLGTLPENPTKWDVRFHQKHERAYLKGWDRFPFGFEKEVVRDFEGNPILDKEGKEQIKTARDWAGNPIPVWYDVKQEVIEDQALKAQLINKNKNR